jgi:hypothetical protein
MTTVNAAHSVRSVALTCDFLRAQPKSEGFVNFQTRNLAWLEQMIGAKSTWARWGVKTSVVTVPTEPKAFKLALGNNGTHSNFLHDADQTWASLYDVEDVTVFPAAFDALLQHDLVVGFELPPTLKRALHRAGKRYISFYIHPVRFLRDLCFLVTTNSSDVATVVAQGEIPSAEVDFQVRRFSALFAHRQLPALSLPEDLPVLIGQTEKDSVLIRDGSFATWNNYENALSKLLAPYPEVIFLEHPYRENSALMTEYLRGRHGKTVISLRANSYGVIFSPVQTPFFLTLASSLGVEARCAGRNSTFLYNDPCTKFVLSGVDAPGASMVSHSVLQDEFWKVVFSGDFKKSKSRGGVIANAFPLGDNFIRNSLDAWAFRPLQFGSSIDPVRKLVLPATAAKQHRLEGILTTLCASALNAAPLPMINGRTQLPWGAVETLPKPFTIGSRSALNLSQPAASHYLVDGFHAPEGWGVWSRGKYAKLVLPVDLSGAAEVEVNITMVVKMFDGVMSQAPVMQITMDGREVGMVLFRTSAKNEQEISFRGRTKTSTCHIEFYVSSSGSPALLSQLPDQRELGFGLSALSVAVSLNEESAYNDSRADVGGKFWGTSASEVVAEITNCTPQGGAE